MYDYSKTMTGSALGSGGCVGITAEAQRSLTILLEACEKRASSLRSSALLIGDKIEGPQPANPSILDDRAAAPSVSLFAVTQALERQLSETDVLLSRILSAL